MVFLQVEILSLCSTDLSTLNTNLLSAAAVKSTQYHVISSRYHGHFLYLFATIDKSTTVQHISSHHSIY